MSDGFKVSKDLTLPLEAITWVLTFVAKRNAGKTYNTAVYVEELVDKKIPVLVIDGMGVWWGLRTGVDDEGRPDPKKPGLPVVIIGGKHADINLDPAKVEKIVEALLQTNTSAVLDISQFRKGEQMRIAMVFAEELYRLADKYPAERVLVVEEADMFAPQKPFREEARCLGAFEDLVKRGGNRNIGLAMITQRSADFNKNLLTQSDGLVVGRLTAPQDKQAIQAWVEKHAEKDKTELNEWYDSLSHLKKGQVWVWNDDDEFPIYKKVQFRKRRTFHATRKFILTKQAHDVQLGDASEFIERFKDKFEPKPKAAPQPPKPILMPNRQDVKRESALIREVHREQSRPDLPPSDGVSSDAHVRVREPIAGDRIRMPTLEANDQEVTGQILYALKLGALDGEQKSAKEILGTLANYGWIHPKPAVDQGLLKLCDLKFFTRKLASNEAWYYKPTENAKDRIILELVNAT
jgi:hypothetical protein